MLVQIGVGHRVFDQILNLAKTFAASDGDTTGAPEMFQCGFGRMSIPPTAVTSFFLRANIA
jgi:hypothetical protein